MSDEIDSHKRAISFLTRFEKTVPAITGVKPSEVSFDFPTLPTVTSLALLFRRSPVGKRNTIVAILGVRYDSTVTSFSSPWFASVAVVQTQALRTTPALTDLDTSDRFQELAVVVPIGVAQRKVERRAVGVHHPVAVEAVQTVFA